MTLRMRLLSATIFAGALGMASAAAAQSAPPPNTTPTGGNTTPSGLQAPKGPDANDVSEVVVTGTRIVRPNLETNNPVAVIDRRDIALSGITDVADLLQRNPQVGIGANSSTTTNTVTNQGQARASLRNLGSQRTLVLVNGHRQVGGAAGSTAVDLNTISTETLDRVDIVTGGSSALYGADAVAGVINFVTRRDFEGQTFRLQYGDTSDGGGATYFGNVTVGHNFNDGRGNVTISGTYNQIDPIYRTDRDYALTQLGGFPNPQRSTNPNDRTQPAFIPIANTALNNYGRINTPQLGTFPLIAQMLPGNPAGTLTFSNGGTSVVPFDKGTILRSNTGTAQTSSLNCAQCYPGAVLDVLQVGTQRRQADINGRYEFIRDTGIFKSVEGYVEGKYVQTDARTQSSSGTFAGLTTSFRTSGPAAGLPNAGGAYPIYLDNPYIPANLVPLLNGATLPTAPNGRKYFSVARIDNDFGNRYSKSRYETGEIVAGVRGRLANDWRFDAFFNYGETDTQVVAYDRNDPRFFQQIDAVRSPTTGQPICRIALTDPNTACVPLNLFNNGGNGTNYNYSYGPQFEHDTIRLANAQVNLSGALFHYNAIGSGTDLPVSFAIGYEFRRESSKAVPSQQAQQGVGFGNVTAYTAGHYHTNEGYAELNVPVLADLPFAKRVEIDASARLQDYTTTGKDWTYGANADWQITDDIKLRGVYAKAVRAPNITELFAAGSQGFVGIDDPCDATRVNLGVQPANRLANCRALLGANVGTPYNFTQTTQTKSSFTSGNPLLNPEKSTTYTAGIVFTPRFLRNFALTIDYYDIKIKGAIATLTIPSIVNNCVDSASLNNQFCQQITRTPDGNIFNVNNTYFNVASLKTRGVDLGFSYRVPFTDIHLPDFGALTFNIAATYVNNLLYNPVAGDNTTRQQGAGSLIYSQPRFSGTGRVTWDWQNVTVSYAARYLGPLQRSNEDRPNDYSYERIPEFVQHDVKVEYRLPETLPYLSAVAKNVTVYGGVNNFTNAQPPFVPGVYTGTGTASIYGPIGRYYFFGVNGRF